MLSLLKIFIGNQLFKINKKIKFSTNFTILIYDFFYVGFYLIYYNTFCKGYPDFINYRIGKLYNATNGLSTNFYSFFLKIYRQKIKINFENNYILSELGNEGMQKALNEMNRSGMVIFDQKLSKEVCGRLEHFAQITPCVNYQEGKLMLYDRKTMVRSSFDTDTLIDNIDIQNIVTDKSFLNLAQLYLGSLPYLVGVHMWWTNHVGITNTLQHDLAQQYHQDLPGLKWINFFINIKDVNTNSGPHMFVKGSHKNIPKQLHVMNRYSDNQLKKYYSEEDFVEIVGEAGTITANDTHGFHKGKTPIDADRLMFQVYYGNILPKDYNLKAQDVFNKHILKSEIR